MKLRRQAALPPEPLEPLAAFRGDVRWHFDARERLQQKLQGGSPMKLGSGTINDFKPSVVAGQVSCDVYTSTFWDDESIIYVLSPAVPGVDKVLEVIEKKDNVNVDHLHDALPEKRAAPRPDLGSGKLLDGFGMSSSSKLRLFECVFFLD